MSQIDSNFIRHMHSVVAQSTSLIAEFSEEEAKSVLWSHSQNCPVRQTASGCCQCNQGIMTKNHLEYFENSLHRASQCREQVDVSLFNRPALTFVSRYLGVVRGAQAKSNALRTGRKTSGDPCFSETALLATSTESRQVSQRAIAARAVFGQHGFVSKTLRRCYYLIENLKSIYQHLMQMIVGSAMQESALVDESVDDEAVRRVRTGRGPTLHAVGEEDEDVDNALSRTAIYRRGLRCVPERDAYLDALHRVHQVQSVGSRRDDGTALLCDMTSEETKRLYRAIKARYPSMTLHKTVLRTEKSKPRCQPSRLVA